MQSGKDNWAQALLLRLREGIPWGSDDITTIIQMQEDTHILKKTQQSKYVNMIRDCRIWRHDVYTFRLYI